MIKVAILGTGNIGSDLLVKVLYEKNLDLVAFVGRREKSKGIDFAKQKKVYTNAGGINFFIKNTKFCDIVFDCTNAEDAVYHAKIFKQQGIKVIDLTPAKVGPMCVPTINPEVFKKTDNVNMITCGGQASLPLLALISKFTSKLDYIEIVSQIASDSAGMGTRLNIDNYIMTTKTAIEKFTKTRKSKVILNLNPAIPQVDMQTTVFVKAEIKNFEQLTTTIDKKIETLKRFIPGYKLKMKPLYENGLLILSIQVKGKGDYLPSYAGNLDIINCAAIELTKYYEK